MLIFSFYLFISFSFCLLNFLYINFFRSFVRKDIVPTGAGIIFPFVLFLSSFAFYFSDFTTFACVSAIFFTTLLYWLDDLFSLSPAHRMIIAILTSLILFSLLSSSLAFPLFVLALFLTVSLMLFLVNVLNFYDGADLNLTSIFFLLGVTLLSFGSAQSLTVIALAYFLIAFSVSFAFFNFRPKVIYLGDSGSFVLASLIVYMFITAIFGIIYWPVQIIPLLAFPSFDVLYVLAIRLCFKHDLLSRNYLHLYQRLNILYPNYFYLLPCIINTFLSVLLIRLLSVFVDKGLIVSCFVALIVTPCTYLFFRRRYVEASFFFGDGTTNA